MFSCLYACVCLSAAPSCVCFHALMRVCVSCSILRVFSCPYACVCQLLHPACALVTKKTSLIIGLRILARFLSERCELKTWPKLLQLDFIEYWSFGDEVSEQLYHKYVSGVSVRL